MGTQADEKRDRVGLPLRERREGDNRLRGERETAGYEPFETIMSVCSCARDERETTGYDPCERGDRETIGFEPFEAIMMVGPCALKRKKIVKERTRRMRHKKTDLENEAQEDPCALKREKTSRTRHRALAQT